MYELKLKDKLYFITETDGIPVMFYIADDLTKHYVSMCDLVEAAYPDYDWYFVRTFSGNGVQPAAKRRYKLTSGIMFAIAEEHFWFYHMPTRTASDLIDFLKMHAEETVTESMVLDEINRLTDAIPLKLFSITVLLNSILNMIRYTRSETALDPADARVMMPIITFLAEKGIYTENVGIHYDNREIEQ